MKTTIQRFRSMMVWMTTRSGAHRFPHILLFLFLAVSPTVARADCGATGDSYRDIPFTVTLLNALPSNSVWRLWVEGPFNRVSTPVKLRDLTVGEPCTFFAVKDTIRSPCGSWGVVYFNENAGTLKHFELDRTESGVKPVDITVNPLDGNRLDVQISTGGRTVEALEETAGQPQAPAIGTEAKEVSVKAWLGDSKGNTEGIPETDEFFFSGAVGDTVTIRLEADTQAGNNNGKALLAHGLPGRSVHGTLPLTITVQLASTKNAIFVKQPTREHIGGGKDYVGGYILKVESAQGKISSLIPARSVEK